jgi:xanthine dehydrogenase YagS FAD-binding subunit
VRPFRYERPGGTAGALALPAAEPEAKFLGGGTNLVDLMRLGVETPPLLVDVTRLPHAEVEEMPDGGVRIGAAVRNSDLAAHPLVRQRYPVLASALLQGASGQLRNLATTGGNLLQRTRCVYFQDVTKPCNKRDPGSGCPARDGEHRGLAILGWSERCVATHPSDMAVAMAALGATVHTAGPAGPGGSAGPAAGRAIPVTDLHRLPGDEPQRDTVLEPGELITAVELPPLEFARRSRYVKIRERASFAFALVSLAAALDVADGVVRDVRLALGGVAHKPWRARRAEEALRGAPAIAGSFARAADAELEQARPLRDNGYKVPLARTVIIRTLAELAQVPQAPEAS